MKRSLRNTVSVTVATVMTALAVFSAVTFTDALVETPTSNVAVAGVSGVQTTSSGVSAVNASASGGTLQYCPRTGCSATSCHATQGR